MIRFTAFLVAITFATATQAATLQIDPHYVQSFSSTLAPLGALPDNGASTPAGGFLQIEFRMTLADAAVDEDFWTALFNVELGAGLANSSGWMDPGTAQANGFYPLAPNLNQFDSNGPSIGGAQMHWQFSNADFGIDTNDLKSIIVEASPGEAKNRQYGEPSRPGAGAADALGYPTLIGSLVVERTGLSPTTIEVTPISGNPWGTYTNNAEGAGDFTDHLPNSFTGGTLIVGVPEPSAVTLGVTAMLLVAVWSQFRRSTHSN